MGTILKLRTSGEASVGTGEQPISKPEHKQLVMNYKTKGEGDNQRVLKAEYLEGGVIELTYIEVNAGTVGYTHAIKIDTAELLIIQKLIEVCHHSDRSMPCPCSMAGIISERKQPAMRLSTATKSRSIRHPTSLRYNVSPTRPLCCV
jgi:hypothetical protein